MPWAPLASSVAAGSGVVVGGLLIGCSVVCAMKGKWWVAGLGFLFPVVILAWPVCAMLVAKPGSFWARRFYDDYWMMKAEDRFSKHEDPARRDRLDAQKDQAVMSKKRLAVVAGLVALLVVVGAIVGAVTPSSKQATNVGYTQADQHNILAGCEEGKTPNPTLCHCVLAKIEANYSVAEVKALEAGIKRGAPTPRRLTKLSLECHAPKGHWDAESQNQFVSNCSGGKQTLASSCRCLVTKVEADYSAAELEAIGSHDARYNARNNKWIAECVRRR
jgi:hypothetical protein